MSKIVEVRINFEDTVTFFTEISDNDTATNLENKLDEMDLKIEPFLKKATSHVSIVVNNTTNNKELTSENCVNIHEYFK